MFERAINLATHAHAGQTDKAGMPYILHPLAVAAAVQNDPCARIVAVLHDVLEDTDTTAEDLLGAGISPLVVDGVIAITKVRGEAYSVYIDRILDNQLAKKVKVADIRHNMSRFAALKPSDAGRLAKKYVAALKRLAP